MEWLGLSLLLTGVVGEAPPVSVWVVDPLVKVFPDTLPSQETKGLIEVRCARNEYEPAQLAVRSEEGMKGLTVHVEPLAHEDGKGRLPEECVRWNFVGFIPLDRNTPSTPPERLVRVAPCQVPDVLRPERRMDVPAKFTQPIWLTFFVPEEAAAGEYRGEVVLSWEGGKVSMPVVLQVWPFAVPRERHLLVTNWFSTSTIAQAHGVQEWSEEFWKVLAAYFRNMAAHRQNVAWVPWRLIRVFREADGRLTFDYSLFDRYVELMHETGVADRIEIQFVAHFGEGGWSSPVIEFAQVTATDRASGKAIRLGFEEGLAPLLRDLEKHLEERGWLGKAMLHICDEPSLHNLSSWRQRSRQVHEVAPGFRRIDAIEASDFGDDLEVWVPKLSHLRNWWEDYRRAKERGKEIWFYICVHPFGGRYPNRFLDYPLTKVRVLHWLNWAYDLQGYLHWGWNHWGQDPFGVPSPRLPPGDTHVVYPGPEGPLDSLRWETQRDSLEDYEYLWLLTERLKRVKERLGKAAKAYDPAQRARELCRRLVRDLAEVADEPSLFHATREALAQEILEADAEPLALVWTKPPAGSEVVAGPIAIEVYGAVEPGSRVVLNGQPIETSPEGGFARILSVSPERPRIVVEVSREGRRRVLQRDFIPR